MTPSKAKRSLSPPGGTSRRVGKYRILTELGRGGMATVYLVVAHGPGGVNKLVVLKALLPELASEPESLTMFLDEARLAAQLNHPNVVQTYEVGTEGDRHVIVMEYLEGQSLSAIVKRAELRGEPFPQKLHLRVIMSALEGLHYAHELCAYDGTPLALVHRDISPHNVFVTYDGQVKVLDFGIAKAASSSVHTATGVIKGKIAYMAPEQISGESVDRRADVFSVGCMLWAAATGKKLWKDVPDVHVMRHVMHDEVPTPRATTPSCDDELNHIVMRALSWKCEERYQTALELEQDLEAYAERFSVQAKQKDLAQYVSELFADTRAEVRSLVERRLTLAATEESSSGAAAMVVSQSYEDLAGLDDEQSGAWQPTTSGPAARPKRRFSLFFALAAGAAAALGVAHFRGAHALARADVAVPVAHAALAPSATTAPLAVTEPVAAESSTPRETSVAAPDATATASVVSAPTPTSAARQRQKITVAPRAPRPTKGTAVVQPKQMDKKATCEEPLYLAPDGTRRIRPECE
ncbi:MAG TPA: protein kinase [Polyangiaceae bacterium]|nr:protein kinase [Polyangiaceae bacterium]